MTRMRCVVDDHKELFGGHVTSTRVSPTVGAKLLV
jgi:hypothetical protein